MYGIKIYMNNLLNIQYYKYLPILMYKKIIKYTRCRGALNYMNFENRRSHAPGPSPSLWICDLGFIMDLYDSK